MRRLLLITFHYPPRPTIGSIRPGALAKYLPQFGWEVVVVTPRGQNGPRPPARVIETAYEDVLKKWKRRIPGLRDQDKPLQAQLKVQATKPGKRTLSAARSTLSSPGWFTRTTPGVGALGCRSHQEDRFPDRCGTEHGAADYHASHCRGGQAEIRMSVDC